jgi:hypothetical protein
MQIYLGLVIRFMQFWDCWKALNLFYPMVQKSHNLDRWLMRYRVSNLSDK